MTPLASRCLLAVLCGATFALPARAELTTWDGRHPIGRIEVTVAYFVPRDRTPLPDWRDRVDFYCRRIEKFHEREFQGQSKLTTRVLAEPFRSGRTTEQLQSGSANDIFFQTLREVDSQVKTPLAAGAFPIVLVLSDINWRPLDDFYRLRPRDGAWEFEGQLINGVHHPGAASGGARATYLSDRGKGWGLVSADGWRVPYCGSDCVVYHEGVGHPIGLPHPEPGDGSVMSLAQYRGWISESWLDDAQKKRLGWQNLDAPPDRQADLFSAFRALPNPRVPRPGEDVSLALDWPEGARLRSCRVRIQTDPFGPWVETSAAPPGDPPASLRLGSFDRATPVSYRVDVELDDGRQEELWGYFQVRARRNQYPLPPAAPPPPEPAPAATTTATRSELPDLAAEIELLPLIDVARDTVNGRWALRDGRLEAPKSYGARIEIPYQPPDEYRLVIVAEPLDAPNGLILGQRSGENRFLVLLSYPLGGVPTSALENIDGQNVGANATTTPGPLLKQGRVAQIVCTVRRESIEVTVDGRTIIAWSGKPEQLSLSDYWRTPRATALFLGAYDCRYRFYRVTLTPLRGAGLRLAGEDEADTEAETD